MPPLAQVATPGDYDDLLCETAVNDPVSFFAGLRELDPVHFNPRWSGWVVTSHSDVVAGFRNHEQLSSDRFSGPFGEELTEAAGQRDTSLFRFLSLFFVWKDPPFHKRARNLTAQAFTARSVEALRARVASLSDQLLDSLSDRDEVDFFSDFAFLLPVMVITEFLGIPPDSRDRIKSWSDDLGAVIFVRGNDEQRFSRAERAVEELAEYLRPLIAARRSDPRDDLISRMTQAREGNDWLTEDEVVASIILMVFAGHETTMNLLANSVVAFERQPQAWSELAAEPELARSCAEELLRHVGPIHAMARWAKEPLVIGSKRVERFDRVLLHQTAANHDPAVFANADRLEIARRPNPHVAFGQGIHTCLGGPLARLETEEAFKVLSRRFERIEILNETLNHHPTIVSRSLEELRVRFVAR